MSQFNSRAIMEVLKSMKKQIAEQETQLKKLSVLLNINKVKIEVDESVCGVDINEDVLTIKVPDIVKDLLPYDGNPLYLIQWLSDVDSIVEDFGKNKKSYQYKFILITIRRKITGKAEEALNSEQTLLSWEKMREVLTRCCRDYRDLMTLDFQLHQLIRGNDSVEKFHSKILKMKLLISIVIRLDPEYKETQYSTMFELYDKICLEIFLRGVGEPMSTNFLSLQPKNLQHAYQMTLDWEQNSRRYNRNENQYAPQYQAKEQYRPKQLNYLQPPRQFHNNNQRTAQNPNKNVQHQQQQTE